MTDDTLEHTPPRPAGDTASGGAVPIESPAPQGRAQSRFGVIHLMVWTACCAAMLGLSPVGDPYQREAMVWYDAGVAWLFVLTSLGAGAYAGGVLLFAARRARGVAFPVEPGEWLLFLPGVQLLFDRFAAPALHAVMDIPDQFWLGCCRQLASWLFLWPALRPGMASRWRLFFFLVAMADLIAAGALVHADALYERLGSLFGWTLLGLQLPAAFFLLGVLWLDQRRPGAGPWTHWVGVATYLWSVALGVAWLVLDVLQS